MNTTSSLDLFPSLFASFLSPVFISDWKNTIFQSKKLTVKVLRLDAQHAHIGGNKLYKLYYNLWEAKSQNQKIITFGGAYSNHLRATAFAANQLGIESIGIVRGEKHPKLNPVLAFCEEQNMQLHYISRSEYQEKNTIPFREKLEQQFGNFCLVPEGGSNALALKGTSSIASIAFEQMTKKQAKNIDYFALAVGTGGTSAGILNGIQKLNTILNHSTTKVLAVSALKGGDFLRTDIEDLLLDFYQNDTQKTKEVMANLVLETNFHEGGYAKKSSRLMDFIRDFNENNTYQIEPIYTGKAFLAVYNLAQQDFFEEGSTIVLVHTGGIMP